MTRRPDSDPLEHYVDKNDWDPYVADTLTASQERYYLASQWRIMWWKLKKHRLAMISGMILAVMYVSIPFVEQIAPYNQNTRTISHINAPPQRVHFFHEGAFIGPFVYGLEQVGRSEDEDPRARLEALMGRTPSSGDSADSADSEASSEPGRTGVRDCSAPTPRTTSCSFRQVQRARAISPTSAKPGGKAWNWVCRAHPTTGSTGGSTTVTSMPLSRTPLVWWPRATAAVVQARPA